MLGCLHKQQLTVKNEGSVAVTLSLSTAAPYKLVSVLPTLSPGQSGQVTVRFDPTESGNFSGNVQMGITGGQGSVSSPPLVGVAHKIEIDPAELSFGLVFLGSSRTRKLTVRNQGVTTVALTVNVSGPYSLESPNSFTLASSQSQDVAVRFTPASSNIFSGTIRLSVGSIALEVPVVGRAMTREEYIQQAVATYNAAVQQAGYGAMYVQDGNRGLALAGFPSLSADDVTGFLGMFDQLASPEDGETPPEIAQALEILSTIGEQQIEEWLWALVLAERAGQFEQEYERLLPLGFEGVVQAQQLITGSSAIQVKADIYDFIHTLAVTNADSLPEAIQVVLEQPGGPDPSHPDFDIYDKSRTIILFALQHGAWGPVFRYAPLLISLIPQLGVWAPILVIYIRFFPDQFAEMVAAVFYQKIKEAEATIWNNPREGPEVARQFTEDIKAIVRHLASRSAENPERMLELLFRLWFEVVQLEIGERAINTLSMINFYGCLGGRCSTEMIESLQNRIATELNAVMNNFKSLLKEYNAGFGIVGLVIIDPTTSVGDGGLQGIFNQIKLALIANGNPENAAIFIVWTDSSGQLWFACFGQGCNQMTSAQKKREACRLAGKALGCRAREWVINNEGIPPHPHRALVLDGHRSIVAGTISVELE